MEKCCLRIRRPGKAKLCKKMFTQLPYMLLVVILLRETVPLLETVFVDPECLSPDLESGYFSILDSGSRILDQTKKRGEKNLKYPPPVQHKSPNRRWP
jgi:hypothetical protein